MTAREEAQLEKLLKKKEEEEAEAAYTALQVKAEQAGASMNEFLSFVQKLPPEWIYKQMHRGE